MAFKIKRIHAMVLRDKKLRIEIEDKIFDIITDLLREDIDKQEAISLIIKLK